MLYVYIFSNDVKGFAGSSFGWRRTDIFVALYYINEILIEIYFVFVNRSVDVN